MFIRECLNQLSFYENIDLVEYLDFYLLYVENIYGR